MLKINLNSKIIAGIITIAIILVLFLNGPAQAVNLNLEIPKRNIVQGSSINIMPSVQIEIKQSIDEIVDADYLELKLTGPSKIVCKFKPDGTPISGCELITINVIGLSDYGYGYGLVYKPEEGYGYGYGYKPGFLKYNITIKTNSLRLGNYSSQLSMFVGKKVFIQSGGTISIKKLDNRCSIRAFDGNFNVDNKDFSNNRIKFYLSSRDPLSGKGTLSGQKGRDRFSYRFKVDEIIESSDTKLTVAVSGTYRIGRNGVEKNIPEKAVLNFDRINNKVSVSGEKINIKSMMINFIEGCELV